MWPLQSGTRSEGIRTNTWRRLRRNLCRSDKDEDGADCDCACRGERVTPPSNGCKECLSSRQIRRGAVHGITTLMALATWHVMNLCLTSFIKLRAKKKKKTRTTAQQSREQPRNKAAYNRAITQAEAHTSQLRTTQAGTRIPQCRCESTRVEPDFGYRPKPTRLELEGACWESSSNVV